VLQQWIDFHIYRFLAATNWSELSVFFIFILAIAFGLVVHAAIMWLVRKFFPVKSDEVGGRILRRISRLTRLALILLAIKIALPAARFEPGIQQAALRVLDLGLVALIGLALIAVINIGWDVVESHNRLDVEDNLRARKLRTQIGVLRRTAVIIIAILTCGGMMMTFPSLREYGLSLLASAGAAGLVVGLSARPLLSNLLAGVQIALTQPIRIDDSVIVEGEFGRVEEITTTYVVIRTWDWRRIVMPLSSFLEKPFQNWTLEDSSLIGSVFWHVDYSAPIEEMRRKLNDLLKESAYWDRRVAALQVVEAEERTLKIRALMSARNAAAAWDLRCQIREQMITWLQKEHPNALPRVRLEEPHRVRANGTYAEIAQAE
jgi:small-conductance mechanosensitive channel